MSRQGLSMKKLREVYRLRFELNYPHRAIANSLAISASTVSEYIRLFKCSGLVWNDIKALNDEQLDALIYRHPQEPKRNRQLPDYQQCHQELKKKGVRLTLLWKEYKENEPEGIGYTLFCRHYHSYIKTLEPVMRFTHKAGDKCFIDYSGMTMEWIDPLDGEIHKAEIFVSCLGASSMIYCEATETQSLSDWIASHIRMFEFYGGVPNTLVPDNLKAGVHKAHRYDPDINPTYTLMAEHYNVAVIPARVRSPKDKPLAEVSVQCVEREILAPLRHITFTSLGDINAAIKERLTLLNQRPMQITRQSRLEQFEAIEKQTLKPLPVYRFSLSEWKKATVHKDYHIAVNKHFYSVPYRFISKTVDVSLTATSIEIFYGAERIALHPRDDTPNRFTTLAVHMPEAHRAYWQEQQDSSIDFFFNWAKQKGEPIYQYIEQFFKARRFPQQAIRACFGLKRLCEHYGDERFKAACEKASFLQRYRYQTIEEILKHDLDKPNPITTKHYCSDYFRGKQYYQ